MPTPTFCVVPEVPKPRTPSTAPETMLKMLPDVGGADGTGDAARRRAEDSEEPLRRAENPGESFVQRHHPPREKMDGQKCEPVPPVRQGPVRSAGGSRARGSVTVKTLPFARRRVHGDGAVRRREHPAHGGQAEAGARDALRVRVVRAVELLEQAGLLGLAHADARVRESDLDPVGAGDDADRERAAFPVVLDPVGDEVHEDPVEVAAVGVQRRVARGRPRGAGRPRDAPPAPGRSRAGRAAPRRCRAARPCASPGPPRAG